MHPILPSILLSISVLVGCDANKPAASGGDPGKPDPAKTDVAKADPAKADPTKPDAKPDATKPEVVVEAAKPVTAVCDSQQERANEALVRVTACVTAAIDTSGVAGATATMTKLAADAHACLDKGCAEKIGAEMVKYGTEIAGKRKEKSDCDDQTQDVQDATAKLLECTAAAMGGSDIDEAISKMQGFADDMCLCKDGECAAAVNTRMMEYGETMTKKYEGKPEPKISEAQKSQMETMMKRLTECATKAMGATPPK